MTRTFRISVRIEKELQKKIKQFAEGEEGTPADFCRRALDVACEGYEQILSISMLRHHLRWACEEYERVGHTEILRRIRGAEGKPVRRERKRK